MRLRTYRPRIIIRIFALFLLVPSMKSASFIFDRRLYELLQEPGRTSFTTRELRDAYAARLSGTQFRIADVRRYVYEQIRRLVRAGWVVLDEDRRVRGQIYHLQPIPVHLQLELIDNGFENSLMAAGVPALTRQHATWKLCRLSRQPIRICSWRRSTRKSAWTFSLQWAKRSDSSCFWTRCRICGTSLKAITWKQGIAVLAFWGICAPLKRPSKRSLHHDEQLATELAGQLHHSGVGALYRHAALLLPGNAGSRKDAHGCRTGQPTA